MKKLVDQRLAERIRRAADPESICDWPHERISCLRESGVYRWGLPVEFGGIEVSDSQMLEAYIDLAHACLTSAFILTQRNAACHRIAASDNVVLRQKLLPDHCAGRAFATVGISHLSTSRQHWSRPSVTVRTTSTGFDLDGEAPWVTGGRHADVLVTGGTLDDGRQILAAIPRDRAGITVGEPLKLLALNEAHTSGIRLDHVAVAADEIVTGPALNVMQIGATGGTGSLTTTAVAIGAASKTLDGLRGESSKRKEVSEPREEFEREFGALRDDLLQTARSPVGGATAQSAAEQLRRRANSLAARTAQAFVACAKGAGYVSGHPAERAMREALFFQVWSCPPQVTADTVRDLVANAVSR
jgi:alkylation response protein AidB-like acyl-CoA dehydrogenase